MADSKLLRNFRRAYEYMMPVNTTTDEWNGLGLQWEDAKEVLRNIQAMWGRPVNLKTIALRKVRDPDPTRNRIHPEPPLTAVVEERGLLLRYDGETFRELALGPEEVADIRMGDADYHTKPQEWID